MYREAVELCAYLCMEYGLTEKNIICHSEGYKLGIASNHTDVMHWFPKHGKNMDMFRSEVKALLSMTTSADTTPYTVHTVVKGDTLWAIAKKYLGDGSRYKEIVTLNGLKSNVIISGQKLKIPK